MTRYSHLATALILASSLSDMAEEKKISQSDLPPAVQTTVQEQSQGATIKDFSTEKGTWQESLRGRDGG